MVQLHWGPSAMRRTKGAAAHELQVKSLPRPDLSSDMCIQDQQKSFSVRVSVSLCVSVCLCLSMFFSLRVSVYVSVRLLRFQRRLTE